CSLSLSRDLAYFLLCMLGFASCFFFYGTATTEIYTLSLHDALPIYGSTEGAVASGVASAAGTVSVMGSAGAGSGSGVTLGSKSGDRKSTRLNSSHVKISYAVFCLKKKNKLKNTILRKQY